MIDESAKQMTWHKNGKRYNSFDGEAWTRFDGIHHDKAEEARNVRFAMATDAFNPYGMLAPPIHLLARVRYPPPPISPRRPPSMTERILVVDNSWTPGE